MDDELRHQAHLLLRQADQAVDAKTNGLFDREDLVRLVSEFRRFTRDVLYAASKIETEKEEMIRRLHRTPHIPDASGDFPNVPAAFPPN